MPNFNLKTLLLAFGFSVMSVNASTELTTNRTVLNKSDQATVIASFQEPVSGDMYVATVINGQLNFITDLGKTLTTHATPYQRNGIFSGDVKILDVSALAIEPGVYPLYEVVVFSGADLFNFTNWVGGLAGLHRLNFSIGLPVSLTHDMNEDGYSDDDSNHDGFRDGDSDFDGFVDSCNASVARDGKEDDDDEHDDDHGVHNEDDDDHGVHYENESDDGNNCLPVSSATTTTLPITPNAVVNTNTQTNAINTANSNTPATPVVTPPANPNGQVLYQNNCSSCHGSNPPSSVKSGRNVAVIKSAIGSNRGGMGSLSGMNNADLQAIADYLSTL